MKQSPIAYSTSTEAKDRHLRDGRAKLRQVALLLDIPAKKPFLRVSPGGSAVWGEAILHGEWIYIQISRSMDQILIRTCKGPKDYTGGMNHWLPADSSPFTIANFARQLREGR